MIPFHTPRDAVAGWLPPAAAMVAAAPAAEDSRDSLLAGEVTTWPAWLVNALVTPRCLRRATWIASSSCAALAQSAWRVPAARWSQRLDSRLWHSGSRDFDAVAVRVSMAPGPLRCAEYRRCWQGGLLRLPRWLSC